MHILAIRLSIYRSFVFASVYASFALVPCSADEAPSVAKQYQAIWEDYEERTARFIQAGADHRRLHAAGQVRDSAFRDLLGSIDTELQRQMSAVDFAAAAKAAEYLRSREECVSYARAAIEREPNTAEAYPPLIRTLLNENRLQEAEAVFDDASDRMPNTGEIEALGYLLFREHRNNGNTARGILHLKRYMDWLAVTSVKNPGSAITLPGKLLELRDIYTTAGLDSDYDIWLESLAVRIAESIAHERRQLQNNTRVSPQIVLRISSLYFLQCELSLLVLPAQFEDRASEWFNHTIAVYEMRPNDKAAIVACEKACAYLAEMSPLLHNWEAIEQRATQALRKAKVQDESNGNSSTATALNMFVEFARIQILTRRLISRTFAPLDDVDWICNEPRPRDKAFGHVTLLHILAVPSSNDIQGIDFIHALQAQHGDDVRLVCIGYYCGLEIDPKTGKLLQLSEQSAESEQAAWQRLIERDSRSACECSFGLVNRDATVLKMLGRGIFSRSVLIDREGIVRDVVVGSEPRKLSALERSIVQLRNEASR